MKNMSPVDADAYREEPETITGLGGALGSYALGASLGLAAMVLVVAKPWAYWLVALGGVGVIAVLHLTWTIRQHLKRRRA